jgi:uncharacterized iron-regulated protein
MTQAMTIRGLLKAPLIAGSLLVALSVSAHDKPAVRVEPMDSVGPRPLERQTQSSVIRDYLLAWRTLSQAMAENQADLLDAYFVGDAKAKLADTIRDQQRLGVKTTYQDRSHDIKVVFYSPEGLSIQLLDDVEYDVEVRDSARSLGSQHVHTSYVAVLTPTESNWKVIGRKAA